MKIWHDELKKAGVSIHCVCTGAGAGLQQLLWMIPGSSAYLSGCSFPYETEETNGYLGFEPEKYCTVETAVDLACAAYMKAYTFGKKKPVGLGMSASVASERAHRGDHAVHICVVTDDLVRVHTAVLEKGVGEQKRKEDGNVCDLMAFTLLLRCVGVAESGPEEYVDATALARERFFKRPFFIRDGSRLAGPPKEMVLFPGAFNPPHPGHLGFGDEIEYVHKKHVVFAVTTDAPHKPPLSVQDLMKRARMLRGRDRLFTRGDNLYLDKARRFPGTPIAMAADALERMLDPKWGPPVLPMLHEFSQLGTTFFVSPRPMPGGLLTMEDVLAKADLPPDLILQMFTATQGYWDESSTKYRMAAGL